MVKDKNKLKILAVIVVFAVWSVRVITLNVGGDLKNEYTKEIYDQGDVVRFENNMSPGLYEYEGYSLRVENCDILDTSAYMETLGIETGKASTLISEKIIELSVEISNYGDKNEEGVVFSSFSVYGLDWYTYPNSEVTGYANEIFENEPAYGIVVPYGQTAKVKVIYPLFKEGMSDKRWANIQNEPIYMDLTFKPKALTIKLN